MMRRAIYAFVLLMISSTAALAADRPNVLWLSTEDISPHLHCYGYEHAITPTLDALAAKGVRYTNAYTVAGVCAPNRTGIITGMYPSSFGGHHMRCSTKVPSEIKCFPTYLRDAGYFCTNNSKTDYNFGVDTGDVWNECSGNAHWKNRKADDQPFFAVFNYTNTHEGSVASSGAAFDSKTKRLTDDQRQDPTALELPPYYPDTPIVRNDWRKYFELVTGLDYWVADHLKEVEEAGLIDDTIIFFWSDHGVGLPRAKRWLYDSGTRVPMIIYIPEKYRTAGQDMPDSIDDQLILSIDFAPTVLNLCDVEIPEIMQGRAFLGDDLSPEREYIFGARDRMDERYDIIRSVRDKQYRYIRNYEPYKAYYQFMNTPESGTTMRELRRLHAKGELPEAAELFMAESKPVEELYDLEADPHEINNLVADPACAEVLERLRKVHVEWQDRVGDLGLIPEPELTVRTEKLGSAWAIIQQSENADLNARLREVVRAGETDTFNREKLVAALKNGSDAAIRYWGAIGLGNAQGYMDSDVAALLVTAINKDESSAVRIAAARALAIKGVQVNTAINCLVRELKHDDQWTRLSAALVLDEMGEAARPAIPALTEALGDNQCKYVVRVAKHALNTLDETSRRVP